MSDRSAAEWAELLAQNWQARAALRSRDLFVASHPGWNDEAAWEQHASTELELFLAGARCRLAADRRRARARLRLGSARSQAA